MKGVRYLENENSSIQFMEIKKPNKFSEIIGKQTWDNLLSYWKNKTSDLANEFLSGRLSIKPTKQQATCKTCDLKSLCRIWELENENEGNDS